MGQTELIVAGDSVSLADEINEYHRLAQQSADQAVEYAWICGEKLHEQKAKLDHGEWLPWLDTKFKGSQQSANNYMRITSNYQRASNLPGSQREALRLLGTRETGDKKDVIPFTGEYEWYTPAEYIKKVRAAMGSIDTDPASCDEAQQTVQASLYYMKERNGLDENNPWVGNVFCNPPYCQPEISDFTDRIIAELRRSSISQAILLTNNSSDATWFQNAAREAAAICFTDGRISFINGGESSQPLRGQTFFYFGRRANQFMSEFRDVGVIVAVIDGAA